MFINLLNYSTIIGTIIGAFIGAFTSWVLATVTENKKFNKRKKGAYALIRSEINNIVGNLKEFRDKTVKEEIKSEEESEKTKELYKFYSMMSNFPIWTNRNWINLIAFIPSIFEEWEINKINQFYAKCDELNNVAKTLSNKELVTIGDYFSDKVEANELTPLKTINNHRSKFRNDLNELIKLGEEIKQIFH